MSFREKTHWVALVTMIIAFGWYFLTIAPVLIAETPASTDVLQLGASAGTLIATTLIVILVMSVATAIVAIRNRAEVHLKEDERDRTIHRHGAFLAYYPMVIGTWCCIGLIFSGVSQPVLLNLLLAMVVGAELLRIGSQIWLYRRGY